MAHIDFYTKLCFFILFWPTSIWVLTPPTPHKVLMDHLHLPEFWCHKLCAPSLISSWWRLPHSVSALWLVCPNVKGWVLQFQSARALELLAAVSNVIISLSPLVSAAQVGHVSQRRQHHWQSLGLHSKLRVTTCHGGHHNVWPASLKSNSWCLAVNPHHPPIHPSLCKPWKCLSSSPSPHHVCPSWTDGKHISNASSVCLSVLWCSAEPCWHAGSKHITLAKRSPSFTQVNHCGNYSHCGLDALSATVSK